LWGKEFLTDKGEKFKKPFLPFKTKEISENRHQLYSSEKILFAKIAIETEAFYDSEGEYASINTNCFHSFSDAFDAKYILCWVNSKLFQFIFECFFEGLKMQGGYLLYSAPNLSSMVIKKIDKESQIPFIRICDCIINLKKQNKDSSFFERLIDAMVYELYLPEAIQNANCEVLKHLSNLPELREGEDEKNLKAIEKVYAALSDPKHPVSIAMQKMQEVEEVKIIEGTHV
ncbi:MAG: hypothetical protein JST10_05385, partial [Bacteroidetes bacterium]|nr:hypothetical protein [Bacteroidota bacterium]